MKYEQLARNILKLVGGKKNVSSLTHCITRLRFKLKDEEIAKTEELKKLDGVVTVIQAGGQYQVVIGNHVSQVFEAILNVGGLNVNEFQSTGKQRPFDVIVDAISGCFQPFLAIMAAGGMIRGFTALFVFLGLIERGGGTFTMLDNIGDTVFMFMPVIIGLTAARKFKVNEFVGLLLGAGLMNPNLSLDVLSSGESIMTVFSGTIFESPIYQTVFGIPFIARNYASSVIPIIFIVLLASQVQKVAKKVVPEMIANFFVPFFTVLITLPIGFLVIGPVFTFATDILMSLFESLIAFSPIVYGAIVGFTWQILVMFGLHWAIVPMGLMQFATNGWQNVLTPVAVVSFGQTAAMVALYFKLKNQKEKSLAIPAIVSGIVGITEPAIYGFTLPRKKVFIFTCIGGLLGGAYAGFTNLTSWNQGGLGIFTIPNYIRADGDMTDVINLLIGIAIAMVVSFTLTFFFYKEEEVDQPIEKKAKEKLNQQQEIFSPINGTIVELSDVNDPVFGKEIMGKGIAIQPTEGRVVSPINGTIATVFKTKHAIGLIDENGAEILIHIGLDTVELDGEHFTAHAKTGDTVKVGDLLVEFDIEEIHAAGYETVTPVIVTNTANYTDILSTIKGAVSEKDKLMTIVG